MTVSDNQSSDEVSCTDGGGCSGKSNSIVKQANCRHYMTHFIIGIGTMKLHTHATLTYTIINVYVI